MDHKKGHINLLDWYDKLHVIYIVHYITLITGFLVVTKYGWEAKPW